MTHTALGRQTIASRPRHGRNLGSRRLAHVFDPRRNSLNALRLAFALLVLIGHGFHLGANKMAPGIGSLYIHDIGVDGFFVVSGFLIVNSRLRPNATTGGYLRDRALRIFPAYWACIILCAGVVSPILLWRADQPMHRLLSPFGDSAIRFVLSNSLLDQLQDGVGGTPVHSPVPGFVNSSLWTLMYEFAAYLAVAALMYRGLLRRAPALMVAVWFACWALLLWCSLSPGTALSITHSLYIVPRGSRLGLMFASGALLRLYWDRIPMRGWLALLCLAGCVGCAWLSQPRLIEAPLFAYLVLYLGTRATLRQVGSKVDLSYGVYLYAWPLQQCLLAFDLNRFGLSVYLAFSAAGAITLAFVSYRVIEAPALRLKSREARAGATERAHNGENVRSSMSGGN